MANILHPVLVGKIVYLAGLSYSLRQIANEVEVHKETVRKYLGEYETKNGPIICRCGKPLRKHRGWCWVRYARSPKRQKVVEKFHAS